MSSDVKKKLPSYRTPQCSHGNRHTKGDIVGLKFTDASMGPPSKVACAECPLRRDSNPGYLGGYTPQMYVGILHSPASIACHKSKGFQTGDIAKQTHCTGVAAYRANIGHIAAVQGVATAAHTATQQVGYDPQNY